ncbi:enoyl-CoA hydratase/isomerase family protein [Spelaeicoccus albus]|uniref:Enoyl-CoA hydratase/carnithine racemase n=1 Tax=Spelaeicoccus albus TaxID=1280376 RepID=A0A7Z0D1V1_9MICO|nr:enoyl-CoA hydratase/isomerase family protein [Spelaeicoccus albus]NYI66972.1 enoyl-CoA hydratase/carnithine racemase [Spelaeicoccus albus]
MSDHLLAELSDGVQTLTLNRPDKLNALNTELTTAIRDALLDADANPDVRAVVLTGNGRGFCAGADLAEFKDLTPDHEDRVAARAALTCETQALQQKIRVPVIAAVAGHAVGGGAGLALGSDMVFAADDVKLGYPEIRHSIVPALVMTGLQRHFGRKMAFELISTGRMLTAHELFDLGIVNRVVPREDLLPAAYDVASRWAQATPKAMQAIKSLFYRVSDLPYDAAMRVGQDVNAMMRSFRS